jgi:hypothetical protein
MYKIINYMKKKSQSMTGCLKGDHHVETDPNGAVVMTTDC